MMRTGWLALVVGSALVGPGLVGADEMKGAETKGAEMKGAEMKGAKNQDPQKLLTGVDLYLQEAQNNAKLLYQVGEMSPSKMDNKLNKELLSNIDKSLASADKHLKTVKKGETKMVEPASLSELEANVSDARGQLSTLKSAVRGDDRIKIQAETMALFQQLKKADESFGAIAAAQGIKRVDQIEISERQPVRGVEEEVEIKEREVMPPPAEPSQPQQEPERGGAPAPGPGY